ncbi:Translation factor Guf1, mitochondrial [Armadillidium vulgare]|nr:Translation factor Guf1, mitochondrial [Armadillidium vulgare]
MINIERLHELYKIEHPLCRLNKTYYKLHQYIKIIRSIKAYVQNILPICEERRGEQVDIKDLDSKRVIMVYKFPLNEIVVDFFDELKSVTSGYATFDYEDAGYELTDLVKIGIKLNGNMVDELSFIVHRSKAQVMGRKICLKLVETLPRQLFQIAIQAVINSKVIARETIRAAKKDVTAKCYGGDVTRKMKLLQRQAEGKKRMKMIGNIEIPRNTFIEVLKK